MEKSLDFMWSNGNSFWFVSRQYLVFLPTALLGGVLTYLMVKTENMIYPALFHFINNFMPGLSRQVLPELLPRQNK